MTHPLFIIAALIVVATLGWVLSRQFAADGMQRLHDRRKDSCRLVGRGELVDGNRHVAVALALDKSTLYYENPDMSASVDLQFVQEVEYRNELLTGQDVGEGTVMRLRCFSNVLEFVLDKTAVPQWQAVLPPARMTS